MGDTGYIDFLHKEELGLESVMKGIDCYDRPFFALKTRVHYEDGTSVLTFTVVFKRYIEDPCTIWMCAGHDGPLLMESGGGMNIPQLILIRDLFVNERIDLDDITVDACNIYKGDYGNKKAPIYIELEHEQSPSYVIM